DAVATRAAVRALESELGAVQALVHAAGINRPAALAALDAAELAATVAAKVGALDHLLQALRPGQLRLLVGFASIIGELGLVGEAHYALANEWLVERMHRLAAQTPGTRCLPICWAAWRETGMAARLDGVLDALAVQDTRALDTIEACDQLIAILQSAHQGEALIVSGRHGRPIDPRRELPALHRHRFLAQPRVFYPGVELVADAVVSTESDPYLLEHAPYGLPVLPLVAALEAMLSAAQALRGDASLVAIDALRIGAAIACPAGQSIVLRTVALVQGDGGVDVCIRCSSTDFSMDHFSARVRRRIDALARSGGALAVAAEPLPAARLLYQGLAFHGPSFQRLRDYSRIDARGCQAQLGAGAAGRWYGALQPGALAAGHPAQRDAVLHALQVCIPQHPVLPVAADRIEIGALRSDVEYVVTARQTASDGREFRFDVDVVDPSGGVVERWSGLRLARIPADRGNLALRRSLDPALLPAFVGR
ncbi:MAG: polyketide synthase dehydratase domain-containing protein, partial [Rubrivivax sp.]|nr:polyketide synthase dehydratase domain-containing protein [Rubrivivax sp.]